MLSSTALHWLKASHRTHNKRQCNSVYCEYLKKKIFQQHHNVLEIVYILCHQAAATSITDHFYILISVLIFFIISSFMLNAGNIWLCLGYQLINCMINLLGSSSCTETTYKTWIHFCPVLTPFSFSKGILTAKSLSRQGVCLCYLIWYRPCCLFVLFVSLVILVQYINESMIT